METPTLDNHSPVSVTNRVALRPPAKLNLSLVVFDRRSDGFHDLHTIMATIDFHDDLDLRLSEKGGLRLRCTGLSAPTGRENLVYRAAESIAHEGNITPALDIHLHKRIPSGAGLGGASSDAAACLMGLNRLWQLNFSIEKLEMLAARLGSDVPFFLHGPLALCTGRGEIVRELPYRPRRLVLLIIPAIHTSTAEIYRNYTCDKVAVNENMRVINYFLRLGDMDGLITQGINSLTPTTMKLFGTLHNLRFRLEQMGIGPVYMSGSGSCLFATSQSRQQIAQWGQEIKRNRLAETLEATFQEEFDLFREVQHHADI